MLSSKTNAPGNTHNNECQTKSTDFQCQVRVSTLGRVLLSQNNPMGHKNDIIHGYGVRVEKPPPKHENIPKLEFSLGLGTDLTVCHSLSKTGLWSCIFSLPLLLSCARRGACRRSHVQHRDNIESAKMTINGPHKWPIREKWHRTVPLGPAKSSD